MFALNLSILAVISADPKQLIAGKTILIISPERWGTNHLSKHHYALQLAKMGNTVFFVNPPSDQEGVQTIEDNLYQVSYRARFRGLNRLPTFLRKRFQQREAQRILRFIQRQVDVVWSFDPFRYQDLGVFGADLKIFHPVDYFFTSLKYQAASTADVVISVSPIILDEFKVENKLLINHGVSDTFLTTEAAPKKDTIVRCGYVGNVLSFGLDFDILLAIIKQHPSIEFNFIGPYEQSNLGGKNDQRLFLNQLKQQRNVFFHGALPPEQVADLIHGYDLFLTCYSEKIATVASNSHKILEYLSTGKTVVSTFLSAYEKTSEGLFEMVRSNRELPERFRLVIEDLNNYNSPTAISHRKTWARDNSYQKQIEKISRFIRERGLKT